TTWVAPGYPELDASWCEPGGEPASPLGNGGPFGGKLSTVVTTAARELADRPGRPVRVLRSRAGAVRTGPEHPPAAGGMRADGTGVLRVVATPGIGEVVARVAPRLHVEQVEVPGPATSLDLRAAGWAEALVLAAGAGAVLDEGADGPGVLAVEREAGAAGAGRGGVARRRPDG